MSDDVHTPDELHAAAVHGIRWSSISRPATEVLQLVGMVILARLIAPADFGRYAVALIAQEMAYMLIASGISLALVQRADLTRRHQEAAMGLGLAGGVSLAILMVLAGSTIVPPIFGARTGLFVRLLAPLCVISAAGTVPMATLSRRMAFRRLSEIEVVSSAVRLCACVSLAVAGLGGAALVLGTLAGTLVTTVIAWVAAPPPTPRLHRTEARELLRYALPVSVSSIGWIGFSNVDYAIIGARLGPTQTGLYYRAYTLAVEYQKKISVVMTQVGFPVLSRARNAAELAELRHEMVRLLTILLFPLLALLAVVAPVLVPFLFGHNWAGASEPVQILAIGGASTLVIDAAGTALMATGRTRALLGFGMGHFATYGLAVFLVVPYGIVAVAVAAAVVHTLFLLVAYTIMLRGTAQHPLRRLWSDVAPATVSSIGLFAAVAPASLAMSAAHLPPFIQLIATGLLAVPAYLLTLKVFFPDSSRWLRVVIGELLPEHRRLRWAKRRLAAADAEVALADARAAA
jgi:lipopolysaccharide exporter